MTARLRVLFLCTGNSARSQMAEALLRHLSHGMIAAESAGTDPKPEVHPMARAATSKLIHDDLSAQHPKSIDPFQAEDFDYVITVCDRAAETCPVLPGDPERIHWSFPDPAAVEGTEEVQQQAFDRTASDIAARIRIWMCLPSIRQHVE